jgi:hypothetical protein
VISEFHQQQIFNAFKSKVFMVRKLAGAIKRFEQFISSLLFLRFSLSHLQKGQALGDDGSSEYYSSGSEIKKVTNSSRDVMKLSLTALRTTAY